MSNNVHVAILGATGYGAGELLRLLTQHPTVDVVGLTSSSQVGSSLGAVHPHLRGFYEDLPITENIDFERLLAAEHAVVISALPHGHSGAALNTLLNELGRRRDVNNLYVIDLSGDLRLKDKSLHQRYYADSALLEQRRADFVYGLPELGRDDIRRARAIANPGCLASAAILATAPLADDFHGTIVFDTKTGSSGSGRQLKSATHHPTRHANFVAYKPLAHQHEPEILQALGDPGGARIQASFVAQSMDAARGIYATVHLTLPDAVDDSALRERYRAYYADSPFVRIVEAPPALQNVVGSNFCDISVACRARQVIVMAALDNLIKGMAGTAIQNLNLMCGLAETTGLWTPALRPV